MVTEQSSGEQDSHIAIAKQLRDLHRKSEEGGQKQAREDRRCGEAGQRVPKLPNAYKRAQVQPVRGGPVDIVEDCTDIFC